MSVTFFRAFTSLFVVAVLFALAQDANGQRRRESRGRGLNKAQVKVIIDRVEDRVDNFRKNLDKSLDRSSLNGTDREDWINARSNDLEKATDELRREFDRRDAWAENRDEVRRCINIATDIDRNMKRYRFGAVTESNWARVRFELNSLADVYNIPRVGAAAYN